MWFGRFWKRNAEVNRQCQRYGSSEVQDSRCPARVLGHPTDYREVESQYIKQLWVVARATQQSTTATMSAQQYTSLLFETMASIAQDY